MARPIHFELPVDDQARAARFYAGVFGWDVKQWEGAPYWLITTGSDEEPGINGALGRRSEDFATSMIVVEVPDLEEALAAAVSRGGTVVVGKNPIPGVGYSAYFDDTEGNRIGILETDPSAGIG